MKSREEKCCKLLLQGRNNLYTKFYINPCWWVTWSDKTDME